MYATLLKTHLARQSLGGLIWLLALSLLLFLSVRFSSSLAPLSNLWLYATTSPQSQAVQVDKSLSYLHQAPVFLEQPGHSPIFAGTLHLASDATATTSIPGRIQWLGSAPELQDAQAVYYETPKSMMWVVETMLPPAKQQKVKDLIAAHYRTEAPKIAVHLQPLVEQTLRDALPLVEKRAVEFLRTERPRIEQLARKYDQSIVREKLIPLVQSDLMPIIKKHASPVVSNIGAELWGQASLWRFGWRYAYDISPLPERHLVRSEWDRFLEQEAIPIINTHTDDLVEVQKKILNEAMNNSAIRKAAKEVVNQMIDDKELRSFLSDLLKASLLKNQELVDLLQSKWNSEQGVALQKQFELSFQPLAEQIGVELFGTPDTGLTPELVSVLRSQILGKDSRWIIVRDSAASERSIENGPNSSNHSSESQRSEPWVITRGTGTPPFPLPLANSR